MPAGSHAWFSIKAKSVAASYIRTDDDEPML